MFASNKGCDQSPHPSSHRPYLAQELLHEPIAVPFQEHLSVATGELQYLVLGSDGLTWVWKHPDRTIPGTNCKVGPLSQLWTEDRFYEDPSELNSWLRSLCKTYVNLNPTGNERYVQEGLSNDDLGVIALRLRKEYKC